ncbi:inositol monophosphatase family protein [Actinoalloteichus hymeniacidonis]|uniref:Inositol-1-monophosphatase n=1 Tax=Actinoalloteichus hymeniacidonis TaxID=340345 RepID=A0AAC9HNL0_9PSEU|nr:inositol monophosphatase family protein [Actinoalloteichus hymeniacidonis]AOS62493.1 inositol monophosphatase/fructose-1,6-bisphosphatase family protein [Actinoalloteichus hymeniacidonis]MBB5909476.1 myo-inositol-1(or 4)-monophosphatase [Actinoalloteichus hymeniacidonis]
MNPQVSHGELRDVAVEVALIAAELVRTLRGGANVYTGGVETKSTSTDVVTEADRAAERLLRTELARRRPDDAILGEEEGGVLPEPGRLCWVLDPIDGTVNYLYGYPWFGVSVAAQLDGVSVAGAIVEPMTGRVWSAARGEGASLDGMPLAVSGATRLELSLVATGFAYAADRRARQAKAVAALLPRVRDIRRAGAASLDLCAIAAGWVDGYVEHGLNRWDWAAGALIAEEAGAQVRLPADEDPGDGMSPDFMFASAPGIADSLRQAVHETGFREV